MERNIIKVLVVDDSVFMRKIISDILNEDSNISVIATACNGKEALERINELKPDVITLDVLMPVMDGLTCLKEIQKIENYEPSIIMLSSLNKETVEATFDALEFGAFDFIAKPDNVFDLKSDSKKNEIVEKVKVCKNIKNIKNIKRDKIADIFIGYKKEPNLQKSVEQRSVKAIVAIGVSTGGPRALQEVIPFIPTDTGAAFLVVQHMPAGFTKSLADRLNSISNILVKEAENDEIVNGNCVYICPGDYHIVPYKDLKNVIKIKLTKDPPYGGHRPSVDVMLEAVSNTGLKNIIGVIMTGMGSDGSKGIKALKKINNAYIIAQDEKSSVVYGMPKSAVQTGSVDAIVSLKEITNEIVKILGV